ncbi:MAG: SDR family oxidoreductase [Saprospiraceae bacterium]|nr:SDR family oxidoreductase [Saprospiraceae bacterium]
MTKKLLVTGASGFLGWHVARHAPAGWRTVGTWHGNAAGLHPKSEAIQLDLTDRDAVWRTLKAVNPDAVFHLAAASNPTHCEANPNETRLLNVEATTWLAEMCAERRCKLLFTSSSQVYDGIAAPFSETPTPSPRNEYGRQKLEAEKSIQMVSPAAAIVRVAVMYGQAGTGTKNFLQQWLETWRRGEAVTAFFDEIRSFLSGQSAAAGLFLLLEKGAEGVFNLGGATAMSRYEFAKLSSGALLLPEAKIIGKSQNEVETAAFRPADLTFDLRKIREIGFEPQAPGEDFEKLRD